MTELQPKMNVPRPITPPTVRNAPKHPFLSPSHMPNPILTSTSHQSTGPNVGPLSPVNQNGSFAWDRVIKRGKVHRRVKKKGAWKPSWKPAYLVLRPNLLSVYKDQDETELRASITLSDVTAVAPVKKTHTEHVFGVFSPIQNYHFAGVSARETSEWISQLRFEARTGEQEPLEPPSLTLNQTDAQGYETTDLSADDNDQPGSPEMPQWSVRGNKARLSTGSKPTTATKPSSSYAYSGNEQFTTSQSDFSDGLSSSAPGVSKGFLSGSLPKQPSILPPIADDGPSATTATRPTFPRSASQVSEINRPTSSKPPSDPSRVVRQGHLQFLKTAAVAAGVKQWKPIWMVLRGTSLSLYKSRDEYTPLRIVPTYNIIEAAEIDPRTRGRNKNKENCFQVICEEKTYRFCADSEEILEEWLGAFKSVLVKQEAERSAKTFPSGTHRNPPGTDETLPVKVTAGMSNLSVNGQDQQQDQKRLNSTPGANSNSHRIPSTASAR